MKSFAAALSVRFFRVTIPTGTGATSSSTGKTLSAGPSVENLNAEVGNSVRKRPVASKPGSYLARQRENGDARISEPARTKGLRDEWRRASQ